jgi:hypothetical protein
MAADADAANSIALDGHELPGTTIPLRDDRQEHVVEMKVREPIDQPRTPKAAHPDRAEQSTDELIHSSPTAGPDPGG